MTSFVSARESHTEENMTRYLMIDTVIIVTSLSTPVNEMMKRRIRYWDLASTLKDNIA